MRARLVYQTRKRGCLEGDLLLATFARDRLGGMKMDEMREFDKVIIQFIMMRVGRAMIGGRGG